MIAGLFSGAGGACTSAGEGFNSNCGSFNFRCWLRFLLRLTLVIDDGSGRGAGFDCAGGVSTFGFAAFSGAGARADGAPSTAGDAEFQGRGVEAGAGVAAVTASALMVCGRPVSGPWPHDQQLRTAAQRRQAGWHRRRAQTEPASVGLCGSRQPGSIAGLPTKPVTPNLTYLSR